MFFGPLILAISALQVSPSQAASRFFPALRWKERDVGEWSSIVESGPLSQIGNALWCLYYADERSTRVLNALRSVEQRDSNVEVQRIADSILCQWHVEHQPIDAETYCTPASAVSPPTLFQPPVPPSDIPGNEIEHALRSANSDECFGAASRGTLSELHLRAALREILHRYETTQDRNDLDAMPKARAMLEWARSYAGSAFGELISDEGTAELERDGANGPRLLALLKLLGAESAAARGALPLLSKLHGHGGEIGNLARSQLFRLWYGSASDRADDWSIHRFVIPHVESDPNVSTSVATVMGAELDRLCKTGGPMLEDLERLHVLCLRHVALADRCRPRLVELMSREDDVGLEALRILTHVDSPDRIVRERYLATMRAWSAFDDASMKRLPCWKHHDRETLAAFERVFDRVNDKLLLCGSLQFAGLLDADTQPIVRKLFDSLEGSSGGAWAWLECSGFRGSMVPSDSKDRTLRVNQLAIEIATLRDSGRDFAKAESNLSAVLALEYDRDGGGGYDDYVQWGFFHALSLKLRSPEIVDVAIHYVELGDFAAGFGTHYDAATAFLESTPMSEAQQVRLRAALPRINAPENQWHGVNIVDASHAGRPLGRVSLEDVPALRCMLYRGNMHALDELARCTPLIARDEAYLHAMLERAPQEQRLWALRLVQTYRLDGPALRDSVRRSASDPDYDVRESAKRLVSERGW